MITVKELRDKLNGWIDAGLGDIPFLIESCDESDTIYAIYGGADVYYDENEKAIVAYERYTGYATERDE